MRSLKRFISFCFFVTLVMFAFNVRAQGKVQCGSIIEGELTVDNNGDFYDIVLAAGDSLQYLIDPLGDTLDIRTRLISPAGEWFNSISGSDGDTLEYNTVVLSANGTYSINIEGEFSEDIGIYTLYVGCTLRDGTVINPGDAPSGSTTSATTNNTVAMPSFSGIGFPGLAPVDFSNVARIPLPDGIIMGGAITPTSGEIIGFTLDANAGDKLDLMFTRVSGNLNLGVVVLSADNKVVFQASLVTSESLTTRFTLPSAGQYTIGVFRIDLLPPSNPEATAFQIQGTLNP